MSEVSSANPLHPQFNIQEEEPNPEIHVQEEDQTGQPSVLLQKVETDQNQDLTVELQKTASQAPQQAGKHTGNLNFVNWLLDSTSQYHSKINDIKEVKAKFGEKGQPLEFKPYQEKRDAKGNITYETDPKNFDPAAKTKLYIPITWKATYQDGSEAKEFEYTHNFWLRVELPSDLSDTAQLEQTLRHATLEAKVWRKHFKGAFEKGKNADPSRLKLYSGAYVTFPPINPNNFLKKDQITVISSSQTTVKTVINLFKKTSGSKAFYEKSLVPSTIEGLASPEIKARLASLEKNTKTSNAVDIQSAFNDFKAEDFSSYETYLTQTAQDEIEDAKDIQLFFSDKVNKPNFFKRALAKVIGWKYDMSREGEPGKYPSYRIFQPLANASINFWQKVRTEDESYRYKERVERDKGALSFEDQETYEKNFSWLKKSDKVTTLTEKVHTDSLGFAKIEKRSEDLRSDAVKKLEKAKSNYEKALESNDGKKIKDAVSKHQHALKRARNIEKIHEQNAEYAEIALERLRTIQTKLQKHTEQLEFLKFYTTVRLLNELDDIENVKTLFTLEEGKLIEQISGYGLDDIPRLTDIFPSLSSDLHYSSLVNKFLISSQEALTLEETRVFITAEAAQKQLTEIAKLLKRAEEKKEKLEEKASEVAKEVKTWEIRPSSKIESQKEILEEELVLEEFEEQNMELEEKQPEEEIDNPITDVESQSGPEVQEDIVPENLNLEDFFKEK